jgi:mannosyltransferase OCH1-like enzyme
MNNSSNNIIKIAEDHDLRSKHIRKLVHEKLPYQNSFCKVKIPKTIIQFWHDLNNIPKDVLDCLDSWKRLENKGFKRKVFDSITARKFISTEFGESYVIAYDKCYHPAMRCDFFRLCYILKFGGFYIDADEIYQETDCNHFFHDNKLKLQPLCYDVVSGTMVSPDIFLKEHEFSSDWIYYVNNNPLIAPPFHPIVRIALDRATNLLLNSNIDQLDIQSTTGPGNLSASLVRYSIETKNDAKHRDFMILRDWECISYSPWPLSYRNDKRNWRLWNNSYDGKTGIY